MAEVLSDIFTMPKTTNSSQIEQTLKSKYGEIIRWAIVEVNETNMKISVSYLF